jgi:hypothetical protein
MISKPLLRLHHFKENKVIEMHTPERVLPHIKSKEKLQSALEWFSHPFVKNRVPDSTFARRRYAELTRPALRWFCKKYGVEVPKWLVGNAHFDEMKPDEFKDYFGDGGPLKVREFEEQSQAKRG